MNPRKMGGVILAALCLAPGCRCVLGMEEPTPAGGGGAGGDGAGGTGGTTGTTSTGGTAGTTGTGGSPPCESPGDCPGTECGPAICEKGSCGTTKTPKGSTCTDGFCDGEGSCVECLVPAHCTSGVCTPSGTCLDPACNDKVTNGEETDVDCGGPECEGCSVGQTCKAPTDCKSDICQNGKCVAAACAGLPACPLWAKGFGGGDIEIARAISIDAAGSIVLVGEFMGKVDFGGGPLSADNYDIFVAKLDGDGKHVWSKRFGDAAIQRPLTVTTDSAGNVYIGGEMYGTVDFGGGPLVSAGDADAFLVKLDANGGHVWSKRFGSTGNQYIGNVAVDGAGDLLLTGSFQTTIDLGGGPKTSSGGYDVFIAKLDKDANHYWSKRFGDAGFQSVSGLARDVTNAFYLVGDFDGTIDFDGNTLTSAGGNDIFVAKFNPGGTSIWSKSFGGIGHQRAASVAVDSTGAAVITGRFASSVNFGGDLLTSAGGDDAYVAKFNALGNHVWSKRYGDGQYQNLNTVAIDGNDNVLLAGDCEGQVNFGGGPLTSAGEQDIFMGKLLPNGEHLWSIRFGDSVSQKRPALAIDAANNIVLLGQYAGSIDVGLGALVSSGETDILVAKFGP